MKTWRSWRRDIESQGEELTKVYVAPSGVVCHTMRECGMYCNSCTTWVDACLFSIAVSSLKKKVFHMYIQDHPRLVATPTHDMFGSREKGRQAGQGGV